MYVVFESPLQMVSDHPSAYRGQPGSEFLKQVPASWDETLPVEGEIAEYIVLARRKGSEWFVGAMTNDESRDLTITLDFLESGREYTLILFEDISESVKTPGLLNQTERKVRGKDAFITVLASFGLALVLKYLEMGVFGQDPAGISMAINRFFHHWLGNEGALRFAGIVSPFAMQGLIVWAFGMIVCTISTFLTGNPDPEQVTDGLTMNWKKINIGGELGDKWYNPVTLWWALSFATMVLFIVIFGIIYR